ncbi:hypothetical protein J2T09_004913 [Neorhizobium huautlense]|uniref:Uncharacterized protein n=1 Tax=Neorhizobium huautlense TaxID=67774 RepID=A0ABT9Q068_9HYPH|nr:hypothetical protein [Neorhizobium huautlense]MDP9840133.1 hypothetical protein [Neorhizobium huautlense]
MIVIGRKGSWIKGLLPCNYSGRTALNSAICRSPPVILSAILMTTPRTFEDQRAVTQHIRDDAWNAWTPELLFYRLRHQSSPWYVAGGWALDLWHGYQTRDHEDLEFCVLSEDVDLYRMVLCELEFFQVLNGATAHLAPATTPLPNVSQIWGADLDNQCWRVDMMIEQGTLDDWF